MTENKIKKANDILDKFEFFNQRAGRELWSDKPKDIQDKDIENFLNDVKFLKDLINRLQADKEALIAGQETLQKALAEKAAEVERLLTEFARLREETTQPYLVINCDDKSVEVFRKVIKNQNAVLIPDNGATVEFLDKASIKAEAIKEFVERIDTHFKGSGIHWLYEASLKQRIDNLVKEKAGDAE